MDMRRRHVFSGHLVVVRIASVVVSPARTEGLFTARITRIGVPLLPLDYPTCDRINPKRAMWTCRPGVGLHVALAGLPRLESLVYRPGTRCNERHSADNLSDDRNEFFRRPEPRECRGTGDGNRSTAAAELWTREQAKRIGVVDTPLPRSAARRQVTPGRS